MCDVLSEDLLLEVLVRVPGKALGKFRCVSKSWQTLISSPEFNRLISSHLGTQLILHTKTGRIQAATVAGWRRDPPAITSGTELPLNLNGSEVTFRGSCNGIVCLTTTPSRSRHRKVVLWNPYTNQNFELPPSIDPFCKGYDHHQPDPYGFGYDDVHDDYKVVRLVQLLLMEPRLGRCPFKVIIQVYSLRNNSWRDVGGIFPDAILNNMYYVNTGGLAKGALHWSVTFATHKRYEILALNLTTDLYRLVSLPAAVEFTFDGEFGRNLDIYFGEVDGCLCLSSSNRGCNLYDIWMMKEYGVKDSWTKLIGLQISVPVPGVCVYESFLFFRVGSDLRCCDTKNKWDDQSASSIEADYNGMLTSDCIDGYVVAPTLVRCSPDPSPVP